MRARRGHGEDATATGRSPPPARQLHYRSLIPPLFLLSLSFFFPSTHTMVAPSAPADSNPTDLASRRRRSASPVVDKAAARDAPKPVVLVPIAPIAPSREATPAAAVLSRAGTEEPPDEASDEPDPSSTIDMETFHQILDLDEDDTHDFSRGMAWAYFSQASSTFTEMDEAFSNKDLGKLSSLGHFLKGSSAALGVARVQASCEKIQHYGQLRDEEAGADLTDSAALLKIEPLLARVKREYATAESWLKQWYKENTVPEDGEDGDAGSG
ncbi:hypothetical protein AcW1_007335 [Taiwanofungus camphoratus]|nr:hypothetical protein AcW2_007594 [Antrodia cinnamomea]KAI0920037.1 hypothetical protein AcV7_006046 [Antrodia cinnamomea]KAI0927413.1 hypothetical protein AcV5_007958 [Antrodia cinnamomea]KAI0953004.1 hypothetical protein AcW1_007335 [Antrodia cinnamomea]